MAPMATMRIMGGCAILGTWSASPGDRAVARAQRWRLRCVLGALGTDTGGSIRIPSALCGIAGLKPTYGRVSRYGLTPLSWSLDHAGPMAKTVEDVALLLQAMAGYDAKDPGSTQRPVPDYAAGLSGDVRGLRIGIPREYFFEMIDPEVEGAVRQAIEVMRGLGASLHRGVMAVAALCHAGCLDHRPGRSLGVP